MKNSQRRSVTAAVSLLLVIGLAGCGQLAEEAVEQAIESDTGEDVEIDLDSDDGSLSITGDDGEFTVDIDEDGESSSVSGTDEEGNTFEMTTGQGVPDDWPDGIPLPSGDVVGSNVMTQNDERFFSLVSEVDDAAAAHDDYVERLENAGFSTDSTSTFESDGMTTKFTQMTGDDWTAQVSTSSDVDGTEQLIVSLQSSTS